MKQLSVEKTSSKGIAVGKAYKYEKISLQPDNYTYKDKDEEINQYNKAVEKVSQDLEKLASENEIFAGHLELVKDVALLDAVTDKISNSNLNVQLALKETIDEFIMIFQSMDDEYMR